MAHPNVTPVSYREKVGAGALGLRVGQDRELSAGLCGDADQSISADERGEIASWVVVTALVVAASIVIVAIITTKLTNTANNIQTP